MKTLYLLTVPTLFCLLTSCAGITLASTGAQAIYNREGWKETINDHYITAQAYQDVYTNTDRFKGTNVSFDTYHGEVLLTGQVHEARQKDEIELIIKQIRGINTIHDLIEVTPPVSALTQASDTWITTKVKAKLLATSSVDPSQIKVVTAHGIVYLMGIVPPEQAVTAIKVAQETDGVQRVVKLFSYIRITKA